MSENETVEVVDEFEDSDLSDAEREALEDDEDVVDESVDDDDIPETDTDEDLNSDDEGANSEDPAEETAKTIPEIEVAETETEKEPEQANDDVQNTSVDEETPETSVEDLYKKQYEELEAKFDEGEIDFDQYKQELRTIERQRLKVEVAEEYARIKAEEIWQSEQKTFFQSNGYLKDNPLILDAFAREVNKRLADKAWSSKPGTDILKDAQAEIDKALGRVTPSKDTDKKGKEAVKAAKQAGKKEAPATLKNVPASEMNKENKFSYLDSLSGAAYETAVAKLSDSEMDAYARA